MKERRKRAARLAVVAATGLALLYGAAFGLRVLYPLRELDLVRSCARAQRLDPALVCAVVRAESRFHPDAVSRRGAEGLMQLMPDTAAWVAAQLGEPLPALRDPAANLRLGTWYLRYLIDRFEQLDTALAAYNAGPTRVDSWLAAGRDTFPETEAYVRRVLRAVPIYRIYLALPILIWATPALSV